MRGLHLKYQLCGCSSMARVSAFQADCCGFESHRPLHFGADSISIETQSLCLPKRDCSRVLIPSSAPFWSIFYQKVPHFFWIYRRLAQLASARALGARGCEFESHVSDHLVIIYFPFFWNGRIAQLVRAQHW